MDWRYRFENGHATPDKRQMPCRGFNLRKGGPMSEQAHRRPMLTLSQQVDRLGEKGVTFNLCDESQAVRFLAKENNYLRVTSYRKLYERQEEGPSIGAYVNLDFGDLVALSLLDGRVREAFLWVTMDVEHFAKMKVLSNVEGRGEDGYAIVAGFYASLNHAGRNAIQGAMRVRSRKGDRHDAYAGDLIAHYMDDMPVWVFLEVIDFGTFVDFYLFCANRWGDGEMLQEHYALKSVKALRNATAHNHCIINGLTKAEARADYATPQIITDSLNAACVVRTKARRAKLSNLRISQMAAALYCLSSLCTSDSAMARHAARFAEVRNEYEGHIDRYRLNSSFVSYFDFLLRLVDIWVPCRS